ncbi:hypothetical protein ACVINZ_000945 [Mesorhizobium jarvisii]
MKTLPIGGNEVISLPAYNVISITSGSGSIERLGDNPGDPSSGTKTTFTADTAIGPFPSWTRHMLRCVPSSAVSYEISPADFPAVTSAIERITTLSQAEYDALSPPEAATLYLIVG